MVYIFYFSYNTSNFVQVGLGELGEFGTTNAAKGQATFTPKPTIPTSSELDRFMV